MKKSYFCYTKDNYTNIIQILKLICKISSVHPYSIYKSLIIFKTIDKNYS